MTKLPYEERINMEAVAENLLDASSKLGELNGMIKLLPNPQLFLNALTLGEAKDSSAIENIVTTNDEIFETLVKSSNENPNAKEVINYRQAINLGMEIINKKGLLTTNDIIAIHRIVEPNVGDIRKLPGTIIKNTKTNEILHTPPQTEQEIRDYLENLEQYINDDDVEDLDPLLKIANIHYQFESIHPFHDGNGRTGRIINILYLVMKNKLHAPILYLSKYINKTRSEYYRQLQGVKNGECSINDFANYLLKGISEMSTYTMNFIHEFIESINNTKALMKEKFPKFDAEEITNYLYYDFYTKNEYFRRNINISRATATTYLKALVNEDFLIEEKIGKETIYKNVALFSLIYKWI